VSADMCYAACFLKCRDAFPLLLYRLGLRPRVLLLDDLDNLLAHHKPSVVRPEIEMTPGVRREFSSPVDSPRLEVAI